MKIIIRQTIYFILFVSLFEFTGCSSLRTVQFETPVDTTTKRISIQSKQTYPLDDLGIYASNDFDGAHLNDFKKENDSTALLIIDPENSPINNSAYYAFKTWANQPKTFYFKFQYPINYKHRYIPKLKINDTWRIIDTSQIFKKDSIITIKLNLSTNPIIVSAQEIQTSTDVKNWITDLIQDKTSYVKLKSAGKTTLGKNIPVLDIYKGSKKNKDIIVLMTRQHPPEITGYYAYQAFLQEILKETKLSDEFLNKYRVLAFPIVNPDGVDLGHWRHNAGGVDLNRDWSVYNQPEIKQVTSFIAKSIKKDKGTLLLGLDFHSTFEDVFYTNKTRKTTVLPNFVESWFLAIEKNIPNYKVNDKPSDSKEPVSKGWFLYGHNAVGITYEIGDATTKEFINVIGEVSASQMMSILLNK